MSGMEEQPLQLIEFKNASVDNSVPGGIQLNSENLTSVLSRTNGNPLSIICICGPSRQGKSFLLGYILRCLECLESDGDDWMDWDNKEKPLSGFKFRTGVVPETQGIWIWSKPFNIKTEEKSISVLLIDTQGTNDEFTNSKTMASIVGLSLLMSSTIVFNSFKLLQEDMLNALHDYINFGQLAVEETNSKPFQNLCFLIRDWNNPGEFPYGPKGGKSFLQEKLQLKENQSPEGRAIREKIHSCFKSLDCFLMPFPGDKVLEKEFTGSISELSTPFAKRLEELINLLVDPEEMEVKEVLGSQITSESLPELLEKFIEIFNSGQVPSPTSMMEATTNLVNKAIVQNSIKKYQETMKRVQRRDRFLIGEKLSSADKQGRNDAKKAFDKARKIGSEKKILELEEELEKGLGKEMGSFRVENERKWEAFSKDEVERAVKQFSEDFNAEFPVEGGGYYEEKMVSKMGANFKQSAIEEFKEKMEDVAQGVCGEVAKMEGRLAEILEGKLLENSNRKEVAEQKLQKYLKAVVAQFQNKLKQELSGNEWMDVGEMERYFKEAKPEVSRGFVEERKQFLPLKCKPNYSSESLPSEAQLGLELEKVFNSLKTSQQSFLNEAKMKTKQLIEDLRSQFRAELENSETGNDLGELRNIFNETARAQFQSNCPYPVTSTQFKLEWDACQERLEEAFEDFSKLLNQREKEAEMKVMEAIDECLNLYHNQMVKNLENNPFPDYAKLLSLHESSLNSAGIHLAQFTQSLEAESKFKRIILDEFANFERKVEEKKELARQQASNLVNDCQDSYEESMKGAVDTCRSADQFLESHKKAKIDAIEELKARCPVQEETFVTPLIAELEEIMEEMYTELLDVLELKMREGDTLAMGVIIEARKIYCEEMGKELDNNDFIRPQDLDKLHHEMVEKCLENCAKSCPVTERLKNELNEILGVAFEGFREKNDMNLECEDIAIGIDLGTTYSCVAAYMNGKVYVIENGQGKKTTPSYVQYGSRGIVVGDVAKGRAYENPEETIYDAKRIIGRRADDEKLQGDMKLWPFTVKDDGGVPKINILGKLLHPEEISAEILKEMKAIAEKFLPRPVKKAVITVPAYFTEGQKQATIHAGVLAKLEVMSILTEPVAAAIAYKKNQMDVFGGREGARTILIFDLGGGTFDVAVLKSSKGKLDVLAIGGDDHLGGEDFDKMLMEFCAEEFMRKHRINLFDGKDSAEKQTRDDARRRLRRLQSECERKKIELTSSRRAEVSIDRFYKGTDLNVVISRDKFEQLCTPKLEECIEILGKTLVDAKVNAEAIQDIVLVGGSTRIPKMQELLTSYFGKALDCSINPDECVAYGAALKAAQMNGSITKESIDFTKIQDVAPMSIGVEVYGGGFSVIIPRGTKIPVKAQERYKTAHNNQTSVQVTIFQGEEGIAQDNKHLGDFYLNGIPPREAEVENIDVELVINAQGILHVNAVCTSTGERKGVTVTENKLRMSRALIKRMLADANAA